MFLYKETTNITIAISLGCTAMYPVENKMATDMRNRLRLFIVVHLQLVVIFYFLKRDQYKKGAILYQRSCERF